MNNDAAISNGLLEITGRDLLGELNTLRDNESASLFGRVPDNDGDQLPNSYELANGLDPNWPLDASGDLDKDGLTNLEEFSAGSDPNDPNDPETKMLLGDVNRDGSVDFLDISSFISVLSSGGFEDNADINRDGSVTFLDIAPFIAILSS